MLHHPVTVPVPRLPGVPTVTTLLDLQHHDLPDSFPRAERVFRRWAYDDAARRADLVITISNHAREQIAAMDGIGGDRAESVPLGVDTGKFNPNPTDADRVLAARLPPRFVVYPANLWRHKNHARLVEALAKVPDRELQLVLTGQTYGRLEGLLDQARRAGVADRITHAGYLQPEEIPALLRTAAALVFPSLFEGFGLPPLEAMACGCPVACSSTGSLPEVVGDAGLLFDPRSPEEIAQAIDSVTSDDALRARLVATGLERANEFTWAAAAARHMDLYRRAVAMRRDTRSPR